MIQNSNNIRRKKVGKTALDWRRREKIVYQMQIEDRACTICINVRRGGKICAECLKSGELRINWIKKDYLHL